MKRKIAKRAFGIAMTSAMVVTSVGNIPGLSWQGTTKVEAAGSTIYVDDVNYYDVAYDEKNAYDGTDLGCTYTKEKTVFKVWSPEAQSMTLNLYATGSDKEEGAKNLGKYEMTKTDRGVWEYTYTGIYMSFFNKRTHIAEEESEQKGSDMRTVNVRIGHDDDLTVAELLNIEVVTDTASECLNDRYDGGVCINLIKS